MQAADDLNPPVLPNKDHDENFFDCGPMLQRAV